MFCGSRLCRRENALMTSFQLQEMLNFTKTQKIFCNIFEEIIILLDSSPARSGNNYCYV